MKRRLPTLAEFLNDPGVKAAIAEGRVTVHGGEVSGLGKRSKYGSVRTVADGIEFASKSEAERYGELKLMLAAGAISDLRLQVPYDLGDGGKYVADFVYREPRPDGDYGEWVEIVEDRKGYKTREYKRKRKLMQKIHGITIRETK